MLEQSSNTTIVICSIVSSSKVKHKANRMYRQIQSYQLVVPGLITNSQSSTMKHLVVCVCGPSAVSTWCLCGAEVRHGAGQCLYLVTNFVRNKSY
jgi:hypothetical protein